jgi:hypothetical protein
MWTATERYLGPATVVGVEGDGLLLECPGGPARASLALAYPYRPERGDVVLVIGEEDAWVIGVLRGKGLTRIEAPGDLEIAAGGEVRIAGREAVSLNGPRVAVKAGKLEFVAETLFSRCAGVFQWVKETLQTVAGRVRTVSEGTVSVRAERIVETAREDVRIDGKKIDLG